MFRAGILATGPYVSGAAGVSRVMTLARQAGRFARVVTVYTNGDYTLGTHILREFRNIGSPLNLMFENSPIKSLTPAPASAETSGAVVVTLELGKPLEEGFLVSTPLSPFLSQSIQ